MQKKYLLWDFDNTLAYRDGMWTQTAYCLLQDNGFNIPYNEIRPFFASAFPWHSPEIPHEVFFKGLAWWDFMNLHFSKVFKQLGIEETRANILSLQMRPRYLDISKWHLFDDVLPCLEKANDIGYEQFIVSNHVPELLCLARKLGIEKYFKGILCSADLGYEKPNIQLYYKVLDKLEDKSDVTMIGDNYFADVEGAKNAGIKAILVRCENAANYKSYCKDLSGIFDLLN